MNIPEDRHYFTINEFARACGFSRASIIRLEKSGFIKPCKVDPVTGYRYYDAVNVTEVAQYKFLQTLDLSRSELTNYYFQKIDSMEFIAKQRERLSRMQRVLEELELRANSSNHISFSFVDMPEMICFCDTTSPLTAATDGEYFFYTVMEKCIRKGFTISGSESMFGLSSSDYRNGITGDDVPPQITACIPIIKSDITDPHLQTFPATRVFSALVYGNYAIIDTLCKRFWDEIEARKLQPCGPARFIGVVAPYVGRHISSDSYCYRLVIPVEAE